MKHIIGGFKEKAIFLENVTSAFSRPGGAMACGWATNPGVYSDTVLGSNLSTGRSSISGAVGNWIIEFNPKPLQWRSV